MDTYTIVGGGGGGLPTTPHPLNTFSLNTAARRPPHPSYTQQHTITHNNTQHNTTIHNNTQQHYTTALGYIKLPMYQLFLWRLYLMVLRGATSLLFWSQMALASLVPFQGPKKSQFSGSTPSNAPRNDVAPLKTITYRAIKTTGTLIVITRPNEFHSSAGVLEQSFFFYLAGVLEQSMGARTSRNTVVVPARQAT